MSYLPGLVPLGNTLLGAAAASVTFSAIPGSFNHLLVLYVATSSTSNITDTTILLRLNGDTGASSYQWSDFGNSNASAVAATITTASSSLGVGRVPGGQATATHAGSGLIAIPFYGGTTFHKTVAGQNFEDASDTASTVLARSFGGVWLSTAAITSITLLLGSGNLTAGSHVMLYGRY